MENDYTYKISDVKKKHYRNYFSNGNLLIERCYFYRCGFPDTSGGVIKSIIPTRIVASEFFNCLGWKGGCIFIHSELESERNKFTGSFSHMGSCIYSDFGTCDIVETSSERCFSSKSAAGHYLIQPSLIKNCNSSNCHCSNCGSYLHLFRATKILYSYIVLNYANYHSSVYIEETCNLTVQYTVFYRNSISSSYAKGYPTCFMIRRSFGSLYKSNFVDCSSLYSYSISNPNKEAFRIEECEFSSSPEFELQNSDTLILINNIFDSIDKSIIKSFSKLKTIKYKEDLFLKRRTLLFFFTFFFRGVYTILILLVALFYVSTILYHLLRNRKYD